MPKPKTYVSIILDRSGSMSGTRQLTVTGYNEQVEQIQTDAKDQDIFVSLVTFNGNVFEHFWNENADKLVKSSYEDYNPNGSTALYDALGYTIDKLQKTTQEEEGTSYLIITITDGEENASQQYKDSELLKHKIESLQKDKNWTFTFMGCSKDSMFRLARATGTSVANCAVWNNSNSVGALGGLVENKKKLSKYFSSRRRGEVKTVNYHSADADYCADYHDADLDLEAVSGTLRDSIKCCAALPDDAMSLQQNASGCANLDALYGNAGASAYPPLSNPYVGSQNATGPTFVNSAVAAEVTGGATGVFSTANRQVNLTQYYTA